MLNAIKKGLGFGLTSGILTTLGLLVGLSSSTNSRSVVIGGILTIAIADSLSDALGMHLSEESLKSTNTKAVWRATFSTWFFKLIFALTFLLPVIFLELSTAVIVSIVWGIILLTIFSFKVAKSKGESKTRVIFEHLSIAILIIVLTHFVGKFIGNTI